MIADTTAVFGILAAVVAVAVASCSKTQSSENPGAYRVLGGRSQVLSGRPGGFWTPRSFTIASPRYRGLDPAGVRNLIFALTYL